MMFFIYIQELACPHLVLTYISNIGGIIICKGLIDSFHDHLRGHAFVTAHFQRILLLPLLNLSEPFRSIFLLYPLHHMFQSCLGICNDRYVYDNIS